MPGPFIPLWSISRSQNVRIGNAQSGVGGGRLVPQLTQNPSTAALPEPLLVDLSDGASRRDLAHHLAMGAVIQAKGTRLNNTLAATTASSATATVETVPLSLYVPKNLISVGSLITITGIGSLGSSSPGAPTFKVRIGTAGTVADTIVINLTGTGSPSNSSYTQFNAYIVCQAVGSGTSGKVLGQGTVVDSAGTVYANSSSQVGIDTTVNNYIDLCVQSPTSSTSGNGGISLTTAWVEVRDKLFA